MTASMVRPFVSAAAPMPFHRFFLNFVYTGFGRPWWTHPHRQYDGNWRFEMGHQGGTHASWPTTSLALEPGLAIDLYRDGPGSPRQVCSRESYFNLRPGWSPQEWPNKVSNIKSRAPTLRVESKSIQSLFAKIENKLALHDLNCLVWFIRGSRPFEQFGDNFLWGP